MADNIILNAGSGGDTIRADDNGGIKTIAGKIELGVDGVFNGFVGSTNPLPMAVTTTSDTVVKAGDSSNNAIRVNIVVDNVSVVDDAVFTPASNRVLPIAGTFDDTTPDSVDEGDAGIVRMSANRNLYVRIRDNAGNERGLNIDSSGRLTESNSGDILTSVQLIDDIIFVDSSTFTVGTHKVAAQGALYQNAAPPLLSSGQIAIPRMTAARELFSVIRDAAGNERGLNIDANNNLSAVIRTPDGDSAMDETNNAVRVNIIAGAGSGGTAQADESAFTEGTTSITPVGGVLNDTIVSDPSEDTAAAVRITPKRAFHVNLRNVSGTEIGTSSNPVRVDPTGTTRQPVSVQVDTTPANGIARLEDTAHANNDVGVPILAVRQDTLSSLSSDGNYTNIKTDSVGNLRVSSISGTRTDAIFDGVTSLTPKFSKIDVASSGDNAIVAAVGGKKIRVLSYVFVCSGTVNVKWRNGTTDLMGAASFVANTGIAMPYCPVGYFETSVAAALNLNLSAAVQVSGHITYVEV